jgi:phosphohistidine phosphatase
VDVYLMQHGLAVAGEVDPDRPLSPEGREAVIAVARRAAASGVGVDRIVHSGKTRALQTAAILAEALGCPDLAQAAGLKPNDPVEAAGALVDRDHRGSLAIVGHLPSLDRLASLLVAQDAAAHVVAFRNGGLVKLVPSTAGPGFAIAWILTPELAAGPADPPRTTGG